MSKKGKWNDGIAVHRKQVVLSEFQEAKVYNFLMALERWYGDVL